MKGKMLLEKLTTNPVHSSDDEARIIYNSGDEILYYATSTGWESLASEAASAAGASELSLESWNPDDEMTGIRAGNLWNATPTIGFSPITDGAVWTGFRMRDNWLTSKDIIFKLEYAMTMAYSGDLSLNANIWVLEDGGILNQDFPTVTAVDDISPISRNVKNILELTNIKVDASYISTTDSSVVIKLWRDVDGVSNNHEGWMEMIRLVAYQD